jgi:monoamine oxidase
MATKGLRHGLISCLLKECECESQILQVKQHTHDTKKDAIARETPVELAIIGAGFTGLYTAYVLQRDFRDKFNITIFEKDEEQRNDEKEEPKARVGGRIYTYKFSEEPYQYGEMGPMRIPISHDRLLQLIHELPNVETIPYIRRDVGEDELLYFNGTPVMIRKDVEANSDKLGFFPIHIEPSIGRGIHLRLNSNADPIHFKSVATIHKEVFTGKGSVVSELPKPDEPQKVPAFLKKYEHYSLASYFREKVPEFIHRNATILDDDAGVKLFALVDSVVHWAEVEGAAAGHNMHGLVDSVLVHRDFIIDNQQWETVKDGMYKLPEALKACLNQNTVKLRRVVGLSKSDTTSEKVYVDFVENGGKRSLPYDAVLVTAPFGAVRFMDMKVPFDYFKRQAIRALQYDHATKIFVQFPRGNFWAAKNIEGGETRTDLPVRTVVYPSFGNEEPLDQKRVLLASYTWGNDAMTMGIDDQANKISIAGNVSLEALKEVVLRNLLELHGQDAFDPADPEIKMAVHTWLEAYTYFAPNQYHLMVFGMLPEQKVYFAGEHLTTYHGWIYGAQNSATRAIRELLVFERIADRLHPTVPYNDQTSFAQYPDEEFNETTWLQYMEFARSFNAKN